MDAVEDIKQRLSIEDIIGQYLELKRAGRNFKAISPFTNEKTPSFMVSPEKQIWHDFSSGKGGNMFSFVMEMEGLDFKGALELLARKAGVDLDQYRGSFSAERGKQKERLYKAIEIATRFYQVHFSKHRPALEYILKKRKFTKDTALLFQIGYSPTNGTALYVFLTKKGFSQRELKDSGLITERYGRTSDMFRGRIMIPLHDPVGRVIGFTARQLKDDPSGPKYINTPQTALYDKSRHVFGLHLAKEAIRQKKRAVLVEGNLDVLASHQAGVKEVVATAGTAMTEVNLKALSRLTNDIRLAFDQDEAGIAATERAIPIAGQVGVNLSVIDIPAGKDPDELIQKDAALWEGAIDKKQDVLDWLIAQYQKREDLSTFGGRKAFKQAVLASVKRLESAGEQGVYGQKVAEILGYSAEAIKDELKLLKQDRRTYKIVQRQTDELDKDAVEHKKLQDHLLALMLMKPKLRNYLNTITPEMLAEEDARQLLGFLKQHPDFNPKEKIPQAKLSKLSDYDKILRLQYEHLYQGLETLELRYEAARLQARLVENYVKSQKRSLANTMRGSSDAKNRELLEQVKTLNSLLKSVNPPEADKGRTAYESSQTQANPS